MNQQPIDHGVSRNRLKYHLAEFRYMGSRISVIIPTKGRSTELKNVIASLRSQTHPIHELIVVDDSPPGDFEINEQTISVPPANGDVVFPVVHVKGHGIGMTEARNHGADTSQGNIISFLDDDVILDPDYFSHLASAFEDPGIAGVTGVIGNPVATGRSFRVFSFLTYNSMTSNKKGYMRRSGYPCFLVHCTEPTRVEVMSGCNMSFDREVFLKHRSDERLVGYSYLEDADLTYRISREHVLIMDPRCKLVHNTVQKAVGDNYCRVRMMYHHYLFKKNLSHAPINWVPYAISVLSDLVLITVAAVKSKNRGLITAALDGLSIGNDL